MEKSRKVLLVISFITLILTIIIIANSYYGIVVSCQRVKDAMLNPDLPTLTYQNALADYNSKCADKTGALK